MRWIPAAAVTGTRTHVPEPQGMLGQTEGIATRHNAHVEFSTSEAVISANRVLRFGTHAEYYFGTY